MTRVESDPYGRGRAERAVGHRSPGFLRGASAALLFFLAVLTFFSRADAQGDSPLTLEAKIPLGAVQGRIDHFAVDAGRGRLFVAELGNDSVGVIDWKQQKKIRTLTGLQEPQGLGYLASTDTLYVANGGDGTVVLFQGEELSPAGRIELGKDADNVRIDGPRNRVLVGYGEGAIAVLDPATQKKVLDIPLQDHPESFQLAPESGRIYVNVPGADQIAVIDRASGRPLATWPLHKVERNYPMAVDAAAGRILVVARKPPELIALAPDGTIAGAVKTCSDADDVFVDAKRRRVYVSCGEGVVDVLQEREGTYMRIGRVPTVFGARTSWFLAEADRLFVAVRASGKEPAAVWVFRPASS
jgi:DNA-binding beta-propeller fold protein YncE